MRISISNDTELIHFKCIITSDISTRILRTSKVKLISGGVYVHNGGMNRTDNDFEITAQLNINQINSILSMAGSGEEITVFTENGVFRGLISSVSPNTYPVPINITLTSEIVSTEEIIYPDPPVEEWVNKTSDSFWNPGSSPTWNGTAWNPTITSPETWFVTGSWYVGYRPKKVRFGWSTLGSVDQIILRDNSYNNLVNVVSPTSLQEFSLDPWPGTDDIKTLFILSSGGSSPLWQNLILEEVSFIE